ncbi:membrane cofactor protein isoform X1 [Octodon degus]|uniref:Membrane cofactor protein n=1 Tax=Octodon degus TaxID=10160 RepID=A0A6P6DBB2_OCTDE|nr:membrane cofactor protein isoform X1 [Octodon degus]
MMASFAPCVAPPHHGEGRAAGRWRFLGAWLLAAGSLLAASSDACVLPPPFEAMDPVNPKPYYQIGETVEYRCKKGYILMPIFLMVSTCEKNHSWVPITDDGCLKMKCTYLNPPVNGRIEYINGTHTWGDQARFTCVPGFYLVGTERIYCELKGNKVLWSDKIPKCEKVSCAPPPKIKNGKYTFSDVQVFQYFEAVTYSCDDVPGPDKLSLVGNEVLYCAGQEVWSSAAPECRVVKCPFPVLKNGRQIAGFGKTFLYQATVVFECIPGYYLNGSDKIVCGSDNAWEPPIPECLKGPKPTHPTKPPVHNYPGYPNPSEGLFDQELIVGLALLVLLMQRLFQDQKSQQTETTDKKKDPPSALPPWLRDLRAKILRKPAER